MPWDTLVAAARDAKGLTETLKLDRILKREFAAPPEGLETKPVRLAVLGSANTGHLLPGLRVAALARHLWMTAYTCGYGQYRKELHDTDSPLHQFKPNTVLFAFEANHILGNPPASADATTAQATLDAACARLAQLWKLARDSFGAQIIQQTFMPTAHALLGGNEHHLPGSLRRLTFALNERLRPLAAEEGVDLLALDDRIMMDGMHAWHDPKLWHMAKQEISPAAALLYGELAARLIAAKRGRSSKCLVLDLDNTLWGGVIGDDGLEGIKLGQGNATGEAHLALQRYAKDLASRGVILAVCSKNDEANALMPFEKHPDMLLKRSDIACFVANWQDKPSNLREIAARLNIGIDSLVFVDDNPFERSLMRKELPMVAVPELPDDPSLYPQTIAAHGYFEALNVTSEDFDRTQQYQANVQREALKSSTTNMEEYLRGLNMELLWRAFSPVGQQRVVQLINKTNQFNLTTQRYTDSDVQALMLDPRAFTLQLRLTDQFGDNGIIGIVIGKLDANGDALLDTWLMSCRVLGRHVEEATLNLAVSEAQRLGAVNLIGQYRATAKNGMVRDHYAKLGFLPCEGKDANDARWILPLTGFAQRPTFITVKKENGDG